MLTWWLPSCILPTLSLRVVKLVMYCVKNNVLPMDGLKRKTS